MATDGLMSEAQKASFWIIDLAEFEPIKTQRNTLRILDTSVIIDGGSPMLPETDFLADVENSAVYNA